MGFGFIFSENELRMIRIRFDLLAQRGHTAIDAAQVDPQIVTPDVRENLPTRQRLTSGPSNLKIRVSLSRKR